ncbi:MAG: hypothetical protein AB7E49_10690 [Campylobacterales bacterium]
MQDTSLWRLSQIKRGGYEERAVNAVATYGPQTRKQLAGLLWVGIQTVCPAVKSAINHGFLKHGERIKQGKSPAYKLEITQVGRDWLKARAEKAPES